MGNSLSPYFTSPRNAEGFKSQERGRFRKPKSSINANEIIIVISQVVIIIKLVNNFSPFLILISAYFLERTIENGQLF